MATLSYTQLVILILMGTSGSILAFRGIRRQSANLLSFLASLGGLVGGAIGYFFDALAWGAVLGMLGGSLLTLPVKRFQLTGPPAVVVGYGWIVLTVGYMILLLSLGLS